MKIKSYSFIDLAKLGRTDWRAAVLTVFIIALLSIICNWSVLLLTGGSLYFRNYHIADVVKTIVHAATDPVISVFGFWIACRKVLRRRFRSLISADLTFRFRRCLLGAALYLPVNVIGYLTMALYSSARYGAWMFPFGHFEGIHGEQIVKLIGALISFPFLAFAEEVYFRGWLTQTIGQYIRMPFVVVAVVAVAFAAYHTQYNLQLKMVMLFSSLGFSALSLRDQRLELAVGAHTMMNICAALQILFLTGPLSHMQTSATVTTFDWFALAVIKGALPLALMYWFLQKTGGWFAPTDTRTASTIAVQPERL
ncbi:CAAX prenyl protease-like protein [Paraburkholderia sp. BL23I1N1]|uniref:CPBP family glutamic-type intramembrane protease n=1 Tax=Paraburkholderia sp. BL23I1N1 TaxID=1938802 RepID=UPI000FF2E43B|nr:CPBP family glutamic-type intramembrane protease [Paraburkholderia sp. BL23I1N1]RKE23927.1 CAAX prenyl protease-like protein [Paraburkholderia sp. BL23I1N1]